MTLYPNAVDNDVSIIRVDNNITQLGGKAINQLRDAVFAIEKSLGINPMGSQSSLAQRVGVSINEDGSIKTSALTSVGLVTLPIDDAQVGINAGIKEFKLDLDFSTSDLNVLICNNKDLIDALTGFYQDLESKVNAHIGGAPIPDLRHVGSHIDINAVPFDPRDTSFVWGGLKDKDGNPFTATNLMGGLDEVNTNLVTHENNTTGDAHQASGIGVDTSNFNELSQDSDTVQKALDNVDDLAQINIGLHRATMHGGAVPTDARSTPVNDGYETDIVPNTKVTAHVAHNPPGTSPVDSTELGDLVVSFEPDNQNFLFDSQFSQVKVGDQIEIDYGFGIVDVKKIESIRYIQGSDWTVRVSSPNLLDTDGYSDGYGFATIKRPQFDPLVQGVLTSAPANVTPLASYSGVLGSVTLGNPFGAAAVGIGFNSNQIDPTHYNLYLQLYPTGSPTESTIDLEPIDVSGDQGQSVGSYTIDGIIQNINNNFREIGKNYRFIASNVEGNVVIMLADAIDGAAFSIVNGDISSGNLIPGAYLNNVIGNDRPETNFDALGLGAGKGNISGSAFTESYPDPTAAQFPVRVIHPYKGRNYVVNGSLFDRFRDKVATQDGYWEGEIISTNNVGGSTEVTYEIMLDLRTAGLKSGKTMVVQPPIGVVQDNNNTKNYGRFFIKDVSYTLPCPGENAKTLITVINGVHNSATPINTVPVGEFVRIYFSEDSVGFNLDNVVDATPNASNYHRHHEIYVNDKQLTFSHERARMPVQAETASLLTTQDFHITNVSPKLRGYLDLSGSEVRRFVRFYVTSYSATSGQYDGYLGQIPSGGGLGIEKPGPVSSGKKELNTRFYDENGVDFIELRFDETDIVSPGTSILSTDSPRYVDIEIFPTLRNDDELTLLSTCEVNWQPLPVGRNIIANLVDRREIGSITELEFTQSARNYINSANSYLHLNGVFRGFEFQSINTTDNREIYYNGGSGLINGAVATVNAGSVTIPQVIPQGTVVPQVVTWFVCVNESGSFEAVYSTGASKEQVWVQDTDSGNEYFVDSASINEILFERKDLLLISIVNASIASVTITEDDVFDARKFANNEGSTSILLYGDGTNQSEDVLRSLVSLNREVDLDVKLRGNFVINSEIDFSESLGNLNLDGQSATTITVNSSNGLILKENKEIKNINFVYNYELTSFDADDNAHLTTGLSCVNVFTNDTASEANIKILNCRFSGNDVGERPPYIGAYINSRTEKIEISNNYFAQSFNTLNCAIGFLNVPSLTSEVLSEIKIIGNAVDGKGSILLVSQEASNPFFFTKVFVEKNNVQSGIIGFFGSDTVEGAGMASPNTSIYIKENSCFGIIGSDKFGKYLDGSAKSISSTYILNNTCRTIHIFCQEGSFSSLLISGNNLWSTVADSDFNTLPRGMYIQGSLFERVQVVNNNLMATPSVVDTSYDFAIFVSGCGAEVLNNNIALCFSDGGINLVTSNSCRVESNTISRGVNDISYYINLGTGSPTTCLYNRFDSRYNDAAELDENTITGNDNLLIDGNINHIKEIPVSLDKLFNVDDFYYVKDPASVTNIEAINNISTSSVPITTTVRLESSSVNNASLNGIIPINEILPVGAKAISLTLDYITNADWDSGSISLREGTASGIGSSVGPFDFASIPSDTITFDFDDSFNAKDALRYLTVELRSLNPTGPSSEEEVIINNVFVKYTY